MRKNTQYMQRRGTSYNINYVKIRYQIYYAFDIELMQKYQNFKIFLCHKFANSFVYNIVKLLSTMRTNSFYNILSEALPHSLSRHLHIAILFLSQMLLLVRNIVILLSCEYYRSFFFWANQKILFVSNQNEVSKETMKYFQ